MKENNDVYYICGVARPISMRLSALQKKILVAMLEAEEEGLRACGSSDDSILFLCATRFSSSEIAKRAGLLKGAEGIARLSPSFIYDIHRRYDGAVKKVWESLHTLLRKGLVRRVFLPMFLGLKWQVKSKVPYWGLTDRGRILARRIRFETEELIRDAYFEEALRRLWREKVAAGLPPAATAGEVLEALWSVVRDLYEGSRELFEGAWSRKRIGAEMRRRGYELVRMRLDGNVMWAFMLYRVEERLEDLKKALELLRQRGITTPNTGQIREALWEVCGEKLQTREAFEKVWTAENIGRLMRRLGAKRIQVSFRGSLNKREWLYLHQCEHNPPLVPDQAKG